MKVKICDTEKELFVEGKILEVSYKDMPKKGDCWQFDWQTLYRKKDATFFKLIISDEATEVQGIVMLTLENKEMMYMNNIEIAPSNLGTNGRYDNVAGCLIAYACAMGFEHGRKGYVGFLVFDSKTELVELYRNKYGAIQISSIRMMIDPVQGKKLMSQYLNN